MSLREGFNLSGLAIKYARLTVCFWLVIVIAGLFAFSSLKYALFPDIAFPVVIVNAQAPLATAEEIEAQVTNPLEQSLQTLAKLDKLSSSSYPGQAGLTLLFSPGTGIESSAQAVETALKGLSLPPQTTFDVIPFNLNESTAASYAIASNSKSLDELTETAQAQIVPVIAKLTGVLKVKLLGTASQSSADFATLVRFDNRNAIAFEVIKRENANTLEVVSRVEEAVGQLQADIPQVQIFLAQTQADYIREATQATIDALILAVVLAIAVIFLFLRNWQATLITALAIPLSLLGTSIVMALSGFNLETITLLAIALVIGIVVDDAIVEVENITRYLEAGETPKQAAILATREIGLTVSASTLTIVAVFLPVALMGGTVGQFFKPFGLTVSAAVLTSLLIARTLTPVLAVYWLKASQSQNINYKTPSFTHSYYKVLHWSLHHRRLVAGLAIGTFIAGVSLIPLIPQGFIPKLNRGEFNIVYTAPLPPLLTSQNRVLPSKPDSAPSAEEFGWLSEINPTRILLKRSRSVAQELEAVVWRSPAVESIYTVVGEGKPNQGKLYIKLEPKRQPNTAEVKEELRAALPILPGITTSVEDIPFINTSRDKSLEIALVGDDLNTLRSAAQTLKARVAKLPGFVDVSSSEADQSSIEHQNGQRVVYLSANLSKGQALGEATDQVVRIAQTLLPNGVNLELGGDSGRSSEVLGSFAGTLSLSVICMLAVLVWLFGRVLEPLVVALSLPLSIVGAMLGLLISRSDFGIISLIGLIFLLGLLDKNAVLLIDYVNQLRQAGLSRTGAILKTGVVRLRPILMTTASTILGMLPIALGIGAGAELRQPMAVAIIGGLITSSLLSLIVVPVIYTLLEDGWIKVFKRQKVG